MLVSDVRGVLTRHWRFVVSGLLATVALSVGLLFVVPPQYEAKAMVVLLPPRSTEGTGGNPYLDLGGLDTASAVLGRAMGTPEIAEAVAKVSRTAEFKVESDPSTSGPVLAVTVDDRTPASTLDTLEAVLREFAPKMTELQLASGAPGNTLISIAVVTQDIEATTVRKTQLRALVVVVAAGLAVTIMGAGLLDRRRRVRAGASEDILLDAEPEPMAEPTPAPEPARLPVSTPAADYSPAPEQTPQPPSSAVAPHPLPSRHPSPVARPSAPNRPSPVRRPTPRLRNSAVSAVDATTELRNHAPTNGAK